MTPLRAYHTYCHKHTIAPDVDAPAAVQEATLPYVAKGKAAATREQRELLRAHRAARQGVPDIFITAKTAAHLSRFTGLTSDLAEAHLTAWRLARGKSPKLPTGAKPGPVKQDRTLPVYKPPPPLDPADPIADYHRRIDTDDSVRWRDLLDTLVVGDDTGRKRYAAWCAAAGVERKPCPRHPPRPWLTYARARLSEGYTCPEIAKALSVPVSRIKDLSQSLKESK